MSFLALTIPATLVLAVALLLLVLRAVGEGAFDDLEGPRQRHALDDDRDPELDGGRGDPPGPEPG